MARNEQSGKLSTSCSFLANNRDPYANCASILYRKQDANRMGRAERINALEAIAAEWVMRSRKLEQLIGNLAVPLLTYEALCKEPGALLAKLRIPEHCKATIDPGARFKVKDYLPSALSNQNERQIANLKPPEIAAISNVLRPHLPLLNRFGYELY